MPVLGDINIQTSTLWLCYPSSLNVLLFLSRTTSPSPLVHSVRSVALTPPAVHLTPSATRVETSQYQCKHSLATPGTGAILTTAMVRRLTSQDRWEREQGREVLGLLECHSYWASDHQDWVSFLGSNVAFLKFLRVSNQNKQFQQQHKQHEESWKYNAFQKMYLPEDSTINIWHDFLRAYKQVQLTKHCLSIHTTMIAWGVLKGSGMINTIGSIVVIFQGRQGNVQDHTGTCMLLVIGYWFLSWVTGP